jgi:hypothetical protein
MARAGNPVTLGKAVPKATSARAETISWMPPPAALDAATIEGLSHLLGEHYSGSTLTRLLAQARVDDPLGPGQTKW